MYLTLITRWILVAATLMVAVAPVAATAIVAPVPTPQFRSYGLREGLPSSKVQGVAQDSRGFIWVATSVGLVRFDGVEFTAPRIGPDGAHPLPASEVSALFVDEADRIWMGGAEIGLARYDTRTGGFVQWHDGLSDEDVRAIAQTRDGSIWVGTANGLDRMRTDGSGFEHVGGGPGKLSSPAVVALHASADGRLWVGSDRGLDVIDEAGRIAPVAFADGPPPRVLCVGGRGHDLRISTERGLYRLGHDGRAVRESGTPAEPTYVSLADSHGTLWMAGLQGLSMLDRHGRIHDVPGAWTVLGGLPGRTVRAMLEDREHGLWFALNDGGLAYLGPSWSDFTCFAHVATDPFSLPGRTVTAVAARDGGSLWVGGLRGWIRGFDPATGRTSPGFDIGPARIQSLLGLPGGRVLIGTVDGLTLGAGPTARPVFRAVLDRPVTTMTAAPDGGLFVAALGRGLFAIDKALRRVEPVPFAEMPRGWADTRQIEIVEGELWQASLAGLTRRDGATGTMHFIEGVTRGRVSAFEPDDEGFWVVRPDMLEHYRWDGTRAVRDRRVGGGDGFPSADILNARRDVAGRLWLYGQTGVWRFDPGPGTFRPFGIADGLAGGEFTNPATVLLDDGSMYGATLGGLVGFRPDGQRDHVRRPDIALLGASVSRGGRRQELPIVNHTLHLDWNDRELRLRARVLSYVNPDRNHLDFALAHGDGVTVLRTGKDGEPSFDSLHAGTYRLAISGAGRDDTNGALHSPLTVIVDAPPWLRWWAWAAYALTAAVVLWSIVYGARRRVRQALRLKLAEQQQRMAEEANAAKTDFMATLGHEIRTPMTGVLGMAELMSRTPLDDTQRAYVEAVRRSGATLLRLVNDALDLTRIESRRLVLESECVSLRAVADEVIALAAGNAREKGLALSASLESDVPAAIRGDTVRLRQVLQNLVNNAVKFTETGGVSVHVAREGDTLLMTVTDTGPGMSPELLGRVFTRFEQGTAPQRALGSGLGLAICHELCTLMQGRIDVRSEPGRGSVFIVRLPLVPCACGGRGRANDRAETGTSRGRRLLLVEDDPVVSDVMVRLLRERGHTVLALGDGLAATMELSRNSYDALLLDLDLPVADGFQIARLVRRMDGLSTLPIVAVTARSAGDEMSAILAAGMNALLRKPMTGEALDAVLESVCVPAAPAGGAALAEAPEVGEGAHDQQRGGQKIGQ